MNISIYYVGLYIFSYFSLGSLLPLLSQYLLSIGFNGIQIGTITASGLLAGILTTPLWGMACDRTGKNKKILLILLSCPSIISLILMSVHQYYIILILYVVIYMFQNSIFPVMDSIVLGHTSDFGRIRLWGAIGFAFGVFISGIIAEKAGLQVIFIIYSAFLLIAILFLSKIHTTDHKESTLNHFEGLNQLFKNKKYLLFIFAAFFIQGPIIAHNTYFSILYTYVGGTIAGVGITFFLFCISEAPVMLLLKKSERYFSIENLIMASMIISVLRWYWYSTAPPPAQLIGTFILQGIVNGIFIVMAMRYISTITRKETKSTAIAIYSSVCNGLGAMVCQYIGGIVLNRTGPAEIYFVYFLLNCVGVIIFIISKLIERKR